jgi:tetratricopeptide (TPR) repeat protein
MKQHALGILVGLLAYGVVASGAEPAKTNNPAVPPAKKAPASPADQAFATAQDALKKSDYPAGRRLFGDFAGKFPADARVPEAQVLKGLCELKGGPQGAALTTWNALIQLQPKSDAAAMALEQLVLYYEKEGPPARVEELLNRLLTAFPTHAATVRLWTKRGETLFAAKKYEAAVQAWESLGVQLTGVARQKLTVARVLAKANTDPRSLLEAANTSLERNEVALAVELYEVYLDRFPQAVDVRQAKTKLGWCYALEKELEKAERQWQSVIAGGPATDAWVGESQWNMIRLLAGPRGKAEDAVKLCQTVARNFPKQFRGQQALFTRAWLLLVHQKWVLARAAFDDLLREYPEVGQHPPVQDYIRECDEAISKGAKS